jgi:hypothetical protein
MGGNTQMSGRSTDVAGAFRGVAVTPGDSTTLPATRGLWIGGAGNVAVVFAGDTAAVTLSGATAGSLIPIQVTKVMSTNTTATSIVALY